MLGVSPTVFISATVHHQVSHIDIFFYPPFFLTPGFNQSACRNEPYFTCENGKCIPVSLVCDDKGIDNCGDGSDQADRPPADCKGRPGPAGTLHYCLLACLCQANRQPPTSMNDDKKKTKKKRHYVAFS